MGGESESGGKRRRRGGSTGVAPQGDISIHMVCHGERTTAEVATQNKETRHTRMRLQAPRIVRRAPGGRVQTTRGGERTNQIREGGTRHSRNKKEKKGPVEPEKEKEKEEDSLELYFSILYEFLNPVPAVNAAVPNLPPRYVINFVPAAASVIASPVIASPPVVSHVPVVVPSSDYSVVSSVNFVPACIETKP